METYFGAQSTTELAWWLNNGSSPSLIGRRRNGSQSGAALGVFGRDLRIDRADLFIDHLYLSIPVTGVFAVGVLFYFFFFSSSTSNGLGGSGFDCDRLLFPFARCQCTERPRYPGRWVFTGFQSLLLGFTGFYWVLLGFIGFYWVFTVQPRVQVSSIQVALPSFG